MSDSVQQVAETSSTIRHVQIGAGLFALSIAAVMTGRLLARRRQRALLAAAGGNTTNMLSDSDTPNVIARLLGREQNAPTEGGSVFRRLLRRAHRAWESGSVWIAFVIGLIFGGPQPDVSLFVVALIVASGAAIGTQIVAAAAFVFGTMGIIEIILVSYLIAPQKTHTVLRLIHDWASGHRLEILVAIFSVIGVAMVGKGLGLL
jgi:hypothetical protein